MQEEARTALASRVQFSAWVVPDETETEGEEEIMRVHSCT